jgi:hypothetical protein
VWGVIVLLGDVYLLRLVAREDFGSDPCWYGLAALVAFASNASLLSVARGRGGARLWAPAGWAWITAGLAAIVFVAGCWARSASLDDFPMNAIPDMHRVLAVGARRLVRGEFPYQAVDVPWHTFMVYQPGLLLPYAVPSALALDVRWTAIVTSALIPTLWIAVLGARGPVTLLALAPVGLAWAFEEQQRAFPSQFHDSAWWPWVVGGSLLFCSGRWAMAGLFWGLAMASRQYAAGVAILLLCHVVRRAGWRPAFVFGTAAVATVAALYLPFVVVDWRSVLVEPLRTYHEMIVRFVIPKRPDWIRDSLGWSWWLIGLPGYHRWVLPLQLVIVALFVVGSSLWVRTRAGTVIMGGLALMAFNFLQDWPVWYLYCAPFLLIATGSLEALCTSAEQARPLARANSSRGARARQGIGSDASRAEARGGRRIEP